MEEGFILASSLRGYSPLWQRSHDYRSRKLAGQAVFTAKQHNAMCVCGHLLPLFYAPWDPSPWDGVAYIQAYILTINNLIQKIPFTDVPVSARWFQILSSWQSVLTITCKHSTEPPFQPWKNTWLLKLANSKKSFYPILWIFPLDFTFAKSPDEDDWKFR